MANKSTRILKVTKGTYGRYEYPVVWLDHSDRAGAEYYHISKDGMIPYSVLVALQAAAYDGYLIQFYNLKPVTG